MVGKFAVGVASIYLGLFGYSIPSSAQSYPTKPIRLIVPYPPGGGADLVARMASSKMAERLGQIFVVENRPGASGIIAAEAVVKSPADGYTLLLGDLASLSLNPILYAKLPYDPFKDFAPITRAVRAALMLVVPANSPAGSMRELVDRAKQSGTALNYGIPGVGAPHHLAMEAFLIATSTRITPVAFKGAAAAVQDLIANRIDTMFVDLGSGGPQVRGGKLKALAVGNPERLAQFPDVATVAEQGYPGFEAYAWTGFVAPAGTPRDIIALLASEYARAMTDPAIRQRLADVGFESIAGSPEALTAFMRSEQEKWGKVIRAANIKVE
jgi:tripartite-type tricarboxylate transporter receptor subunit TctC